MLSAIVELGFGPLLVALSTLAGRRWGQWAGGTVSAFPVVVGPVLLIGAQQHGARFAAVAATGTLLGLATLSAFAVAYCRVAVVADWRLGLIAGWAAAAIGGLVIGLGAGRVGFAAALLVACGSLSIASGLLPRSGALPAAGAVTPSTARDLPVRMALTALLIAALTLAAGWFGPLIGGMLAALPILASMLAVFTHRQHGATAVIVFVRGMLSGMASFVGFCAAVAALAVPVGVPVAFGAALLAAVTLHVASLAVVPGSPAWASNRPES
jgi:hypothetical protein